MFYQYILLAITQLSFHGAKSGSEARNIDIKLLLGEIDDNSLQEYLETCKHFPVDSEIKNGSFRLFNFAIVSVNLHLFIENLDLVFDSLKCAAKLNVALGFVLKNLDKGSRRYCYSQKSNTLMEQS